MRLRQEEDKARDSTSEDIEVGQNQTQYVHMNFACHARSISFHVRDDLRSLESWKNNCWMKLSFSYQGFRGKKFAANLEARTATK